MRDKTVAQALEKIAGSFPTYIEGLIEFGMAVHDQDPQGNNVNTNNRIREIGNYLREADRRWDIQPEKISELRTKYDLLKAKYKK